MKKSSNPAPQSEAWTLLVKAAWAQLNGNAPVTVSVPCEDDKGLRRLADRHRMLPMLVGNTSPQELPPGFQQRAYGLAAYGNSLVQDLHRLREVFDDANIRWFTYKGPVLSMDLYGDPLLRPCDDLDVLVHPGDLEKATLILSREHYVLAQDLAPAAMKEHLRGNWGLDFRSPENGHLIELKTDIAPRFYALPFENLLDWDHPRQVELDGTLFPTLPEAEQLLALAAHGTWHCWERLLWLVDLAQSLQREPDIPKLRRQASTLGLGRMLDCGIQLVETLWSDGTLDDSNDATLLKMCNEVTEAFPVPAPPPVSVRTLLRFHLLSRERHGDRIRYGFRFLFTSNEADWDLLDLPVPLAFLYRFVRPVRLLLNGVRRLF